MSEYEQDMLNGFTAGTTFTYCKTIGKPFAYFKATCFTTLGIGARIPWQATVTVEPRRIWPSSPDQTPFPSSLSLGTLDGSSEFYRNVGVRADHLYNGQELVLQAGAGIAVQFEVLGKTIINRPPQQPARRLGHRSRYYRHGAVYSNAAYHSELTILPFTRIRGTLRFSNISSFLNDINISTPWLPLFLAQFNVPQLGPHDGTEDTIEAYILNKRELATPKLDPTGHEIAFDGVGEWTVAVNLPDSGVSQLTECLPDDLSPAPGSILGGGLYDAIDHSITWVFPEGVPPAEVSYRIQAPAAAAPRPLGQWIPEGQSAPLAILTPGDSDLSGAELALQVRELLQRPTLEEIQDARLGSTVIEVGPDGAVRLTLELETSDDLRFWNPASEAVPTPIVVDYDLPAEKRFFRFTMK